MSDDLAEKNYYDYIDSAVKSMLSPLSSDLMKTEVPIWSRRMYPMCWCVVTLCVLAVAVFLASPETSYQYIYGTRTIADVQFFHEKFDTYETFASSLQPCHNDPVTPDEYRELNESLRQVLTRDLPYYDGFMCTTMHHNAIVLPCACIMQWPTKQDTLFLLQPTFTPMWHASTFSNNTLRLDFINDGHSKYHQLNLLPLAVHVRHYDEYNILRNLSVFERSVPLFYFMRNLLYFSDN